MCACVHVRKNWTRVCAYTTRMCVRPPVLERQDPLRVLWRGVLKQLLVIAIYCFIVVRVLLFYIYEKKYKKGKKEKRKEKREGERKERARERSGNNNRLVRLAKQYGINGNHLKETVEVAEHTHLLQSFILARLEVGQQWINIEKEKTARFPAHRVSG